MGVFSKQGECQTASRPCGFPQITPVSNRQSTSQRSMPIPTVSPQQYINKTVTPRIQHHKRQLKVFRFLTQRISVPIAANPFRPRLRPQSSPMNKMRHPRFVVSSKPCRHDFHCREIDNSTPLAKQNARPVLCPRERVGCHWLIRCFAERRITRAHCHAKHRRLL